MSDGYPLVALVVPVHNNKADTTEFLESLKGVTYPNYKIIIIDDGSTDGTEDMIKENYPYVILLKGDGNLWWSGATNMGIKKAIVIGADYVVLGGMNDTIVDSEFITALVDTAENNPHSITLPKVYFYDNPKKLSFAGGDINWLKGWPTCIGAGEIDTGQYDLQCDIKHGGLGILVNTSFFEDIGMMDFKNFPMYWGDTDFTYRAYKKGYRIIYEPKSMMWHKMCSTVKKENLKTTSFLSTLIFATTNMRSVVNFRIVVKFYSRHCPRYLLPYVLMRYALLVILLSLMSYSPSFRGTIDKLKTLYR